MQSPEMGEPRKIDRLVVVLGLSQITGWGTTYYLPGILGDAFEAASGLSRPLVFAGVTIMLLCSSAAAPFAGKFIDRRGARSGMLISYVTLSLGLLVLAATQGALTYYGAWLLFGIAMPFGLAGGAQAALVQDRGQAARLAISYVLMLTSLSQAIYWPLTAWLDSIVGWRALCVIFAVMNLGAAAVLAVFLRRGPPNVAAFASDGGDGGALPQESRQRALPIVIIAMASSGFVSWGLELHAMEILLAFGITQAVALMIVGLRGPISLISRSADIVLGGRISPLDIALVGCLTMFLSLIAAAVGTGVPGAIIFMLLFAAGTGIMTISRATLQLALFGPRGYATLAGRIGRPAHFVYAIAPPVLGYVSEYFGLGASLALSMLAMTIALAALLAIRRMTG